MNILKKLPIVLIGVFCCLTHTAQALPDCDDASCLVEVTSREDVIADDASCTFREAIEAVRRGANYSGCLAAARATTVLLPAGEISLSLTEAQVLAALPIGHSVLAKNMRISGHPEGSALVKGAHREDAADDILQYTVKAGFELHLVNLSVGGINQNDSLFKVNGLMRMRNVSFSDMTLSLGVPIIKIEAGGRLDAANCHFLFNAALIAENRGQAVLSHITYRHSHADKFLVMLSGSNTEIGRSILMNVRRDVPLCRADAGALVVSLGYNMASGPHCLTFNPESDRTDVPIQDIGFGQTLATAGVGSTQTIIEGSPAIDLIPSQFCTEIFDSRGRQRPIDGDRNGVAACDAGAYEFVPEIPLGNAQDPDADGLGHPQDNCPFTANPNQADGDGDGVGNACDNCAAVGNGNQADADQNGLGDACDDADGDGVLSVQDNCPQNANNDQRNRDADGLGDVCDPDKDGDGIPNPQDNCPEFANADQFDEDNDGIGAMCEEGDGDLNPQDPSADGDGDTVADTEDNCPLDANLGQPDSDSDGRGDVCDPDRDNDGIANAADNCPISANHAQSDSNENGIGDACDQDDDADGSTDELDNCPFTANSDQSDADGDGLGDACDDVDHRDLVALQPAQADDENPPGSGEGSGEGSGGLSEGDSSPSGDQASGSSASTGGGCSMTMTAGSDGAEMFLWPYLMLLSLAAVTMFRQRRLRIIRLNRNFPVTGMSEETQVQKPR